VEITERTLLQGEYQSNKVLRQLDQLGVRLSIDDYGTGYSSLSVLRRLPIRQVKIDKSFIDGLPGDRDNDQIVQSTIRLAHALGAVTVGEGVETPVQLSHLCELGCDIGQGYLLGRPCPADEITEAVRSSRRRDRQTAAEESLSVGLPTLVD
jgi:EAL domain-containing protein (putative c-di-GMP-specific phosphodiesterase class I)